jgi:elongation factor Ts
MIKELWEATGAGLLECKKALEASNGDFERAVNFLREKGLAKAANKVGRETQAGLVIVEVSRNSACAVQVQCETDFVARTDEFKGLAHCIADQVLTDASLTDAAKLLAANSIDAPSRSNADRVQELIGRLGENIIVSRVARYAAGGAGIVEAYIHAGDIEANYGPTEGRIGVLIELGVHHVTAASNASLKDLTHDLALHVTSAAPRYLSPDDIPDNVMQQERESWMAQLAGENKPDLIKAKIIEGQLYKFYQQVCLLKQAFVKDDSISIETLLQQKSREMGTLVTIKRFARLEVGT